jgi:hypothetical protein
MRVISSWCNDAHRRQRCKRTIVESDGGIRLIDRIEQLVFVVTFEVVGSKKATVNKAMGMSR